MNNFTIEDLLNLNTNSNPKGDRIFFKEDSIDGAFTKPQFLTYIGALLKSKKEWQVKHFKDLLVNMALKRKINNNIEVTYQDGQEQIWCRFGFGNTKQHLCIANDGDLLTFIKNYADGLISVNFTYEDLVRQAYPENS